MSGQSKKPWDSRLPERFRDWREESRIKAAIEAINAIFRPKIAAADSEEEERAIDQEWTYETEDYATSLALLKTKYLSRLAERWDVEIPPDAWTSDQFETFRYIYPAAQLRLRKSITATKRESIRWWIQVTVLPLTGLAGTLIGLVSLLTRK